MKKLYVLFALLFSFAMVQQLSAQDTIVVQTLTWDSTGRSGTFTFPDDPNQSYRKILMRYNMRCHDGLVGGATVGCYEWDYSCNTFITDPSRVDSNMATHPTHTVSNFSGDVFDYTTQPTYTYTQYDQQEVTYTSTISEATYSIGSYNEDLSLQSGQKVGKYQYLFSAAELTDAGLSAGPITGLKLFPISSGDPLNYLRIRIKATSKVELDPNDPDLDGFTEVYFLNTPLATTETQLNFYQTFNWDGASNIIVEYSYTNAIAGIDNVVESDSGPAGSALTNQQEDYAVLFEGSGQVEVDPTPFNQISNEITIALWQYGNPDVMPVNSTIFEGRDNNNNRQANVHLPWSNSQVYWDCGNDGSGYDRINKTADPAEFEGRWNHWAFTKNASTGEMRIYVNGQLWHSGTGNTRPINLSNLTLGSDANGSNNYYGSVNEFQVWSKALDQATIQEWMRKTITDSHPDYANLVTYLPLNEGTGTTTADLSANNLPATIVNAPSWQPMRGSQLYHAFEASGQRPVLEFIRGEYMQTTDVVMVTDSVQNSPNQVVTYGVDGTDLVVLNTEFFYEAAPSSILNEAGDEIGTVPVAAEGQINIGSLQYYNKFDAKYEILSLVTPYGIGLDLTPEGKTFTFDVSDFAPILKGEKFLSVEMGGQFQEELDIQFLYITGTPEREVIEFQNIWPFRRGYFGQIQDDVVFEPRDVLMHPDGEWYKIRSSVTGHQQNGEFVPRTHYIDIDGGPIDFEYQVWKECGDNPIYPQGGTWTFARAGWCPGAPTDVNEFDITFFANPGETTNIDYGLVGPFMESANYLVSNQLVTYGPYNHDKDASLEAIARPSRRVEYERINPACNLPVVVVKNAGGSNFSSVTIDYWVVGNPGKQTYTHNESLLPGETTEITLPVDNIGFWQTAATEKRFIAEITAVNGNPDDYADNDRMVSGFDIPEIFELDFDLLLNVRTNNRASENFYTIKDAQGNVVLSRYNMSNATTYNDELNLPPGCYSLHFQDDGDDGLSYWYWDVVDPSVGSGYFRIQRLINGIPITVQSFESEFGTSVDFDFVIGEITSTDETVAPSLFTVYPNPASTEVTVELQGFEGLDIQVQLMDLTGRMISTQMIEQCPATLRHGIDLSRLPSGMYFVRVSHAGKTWVREVVK